METLPLQALDELDDEAAIESITCVKGTLGAGLSLPIKSEREDTGHYVWMSSERTSRRR